MPYDLVLRLIWCEVEVPTSFSVQDSYQGIECRSLSLGCDRLQHLVVVDSGIHLQLFVQVAPVSTHPLAVVKPASHADTSQEALLDIWHIACCDIVQYKQSYNGNPLMKLCMHPFATKSFS